MFVKVKWAKQKERVYKKSRKLVGKKRTIFFLVFIQILKVTSQVTVKGDYRVTIKLIRWIRSRRS